MIIGKIYIPSGPASEGPSRKEKETLSGTVKRSLPRTVPFGDILNYHKLDWAPVPMVEDKAVKMPNTFVRGLYTAMAVAGIVLYIVWMIAASIVNGKVMIFDLGLYSVCIILILMGLTGRFLYSEKIKKEKSSA